MIPGTEHETWQNASKGTVLVLKYDRQGKLSHEVVYGGRKVDLSTYERQLNSDRAYDETLDVFKNGTMIPAKLIDTADDIEEIKENPHLKSESDLKELFGLHWKKFDEHLQDISSVTQLTKMLEIADELDATVRQVASIKSRLMNVDPQAYAYLTDSVTSA